MKGKTQQQQNERYFNSFALWTLPINFLQVYTLMVSICRLINFIYHLFRCCCVFWLCLLLDCQWQKKWATNGSSYIWNYLFTDEKWLMTFNKKHSFHWQKRGKKNTHTHIMRLFSFRFLYSGKYLIEKPYWVYILCSQRTIYYRQDSFKRMMYDIHGCHCCLHYNRRPVSFNAFWNG